MFIAGDGEVVPPLLHGADLPAVQEGADAFEESGGIQIVFFQFGQEKELLSASKTDGLGKK